MKLGYVILYVADVPAAVSFYERAFGLARRFVHESNQFAEMETGGTALAFADETLVAGDLDFQPVRPGGPPPGIEVALVTEDVDAAVAQAVAVGAVLVKPPVRKPWGQTVAYVRDPHGFLVELCTEVG